MNDVQNFLDEAVNLAFDNIERGGRPFGAVVVKDGKRIAQGINQMLSSNDPTAHAELAALRSAGATLGAYRLDDCEVYASGQPCPMCMAAMRMAGVKRIGFVYSNEQAEPYGLSSAAIAQDVSLPLEEQNWAVIEHHPREDDARGHLYEVWQAHNAGR